MAFIDILTGQLFVLGFIELLLLYIAVDAYAFYRSRFKSKMKDIPNFETPSSLTSGSIVLSILGLYAIFTGLYGIFTWPLPGSYNILFYDLYTIMGFLLFSVAFTIRHNFRLRYTGFLTMLLGIVVIYYGIVGYILKLTSDPLVLLILYTLLGLAGIFALPETIMLDRSRENIKNRSKLWIVVTIIFWALLLLGAMLAIFIGGSAAFAHLATAP